MTVGRDHLAWLAAVPGLASAEIIARRSPLAAYLYRTRNGHLPLGATGYRLEPNVVYQEGTEKTARAMFAYRVGMTMAEWACRSLMGLGPTIHAEAVPYSQLPGPGPGWSQQHGQPDLVGFHWRSPRTWLVEAKAARRLGKPELSKGVSQLSAIGMMNGPHMRVLCGTSIEHRVFMTIDIEAAGSIAESGMVQDGQRQGPDEDDAELIALARSRMLNFYLLQALPRESLSVRPIGPTVAAAQYHQGRATEVVIPLETDESTRIEREQLRLNPAIYSLRSPSSRFDLLTGPVPGTDIVLGMSRRLFAACRSLAAEQAQLLLAAQAGLPDLPVTEHTDEEAIEYQIRERRAFFAEQEATADIPLRETTRQAYEIGRESSWQQLIDVQPQLVAEPPANLLESATPDTYLAIDASTITAADG